jgi:hypothetical protein
LPQRLVETYAQLRQRQEECFRSASFNNAAMVSGDESCGYLSRFYSLRLC